MAPSVSYQQNSKLISSDCVTCNTALMIKLTLFTDKKFKNALTKKHEQEYPGTLRETSSKGLEVLRLDI